MSLSFERQTAVVTGAGSGIGFAIPMQLACRGASVVVNDIDPGRMDAAVAAINASGGCAVGLQGDAGDVNVAWRRTARAVEEFGHLDLAIANAGVTLFNDFLSFPPEEFQRLLSARGNCRGRSFFAIGRRRPRYGPHGDRWGMVRQREVLQWLDAR